MASETGAGTGRAGAETRQVASGALAAGRLALSLLTVLPVGRLSSTAGEPAGGGRAAGSGGPSGSVELGAVAGWFPAVGGLIGALAGAILYGAGLLLGSAPAAVLAVIALVGVTGALHQDGLADLADALGARGGRERRLEVMRDSALGAFGVLALVLWAALMIAVLAALPRGHALQALVIACALARWAAVLHAYALPPARREGLGAAFAPAPSAVLAASLLAAATFALEPLPALAGLIAAALLAAAVGALASRLLGGRTGDTLGATVALSEAAVCAVLLAFAR
jgi:adenosylcobinamide-GDP ribazoletransferase